MATTNHGSHAVNTDQSNIHGNNEQTDDIHRGLDASTADNPRENQQTTTHHSRTEPGTHRPPIERELGHASSNHIETFNCLEQYLAQQGTIANYALQRWFSQPIEDEPSPIIPESFIIDGCYHRAEGDEDDYGSGTGATWGGSTGQDD